MTDRYWIAVDMDGTLLNSRGQISERTCAVLQKCLDQGHHVLPATGRALPLLPEKSKIFREFRMRFLETDPLSGIGKRHVHYIKMSSGRIGRTDLKGCAGKVPGASGKSRERITLLCRSYLRWKSLCGQSRQRIFPYGRNRREFCRIYAFKPRVCEKIRRPE